MKDDEKTERYHYQTNLVHTTTDGKVLPKGSICWAERSRDGTLLTLEVEGFGKVELDGSLYYLRGIERVGNSDQSLSYMRGVEDHSSGAYITDALESALREYEEGDDSDTKSG